MSNSKLLKYARAKDDASFTWRIAAAQIIRAQDIEFDDLSDASRALVQTILANPMVAIQTFVNHVTTSAAIAENITVTPMGTVDTSEVPDDDIIWTVNEVWDRVARSMFPDLSTTAPALAAPAAPEPAPVAAEPVPAPAPEPAPATEPATDSATEPVTEPAPEPAPVDQSTPPADPAPAEPAPADPAAAPADPAPAPADPAAAPEQPAPADPAPSDSPAPAEPAPADAPVADSTTPAPQTP